MADRGGDDAAKPFRSLARTQVARHQGALAQLLQELKRPPHFGQVLAHARRATVESRHFRNQPDEFTLAVIFEIGAKASVNGAIVVENWRHEAIFLYRMLGIPAQILAGDAREAHAQQYGGGRGAVANE